MPRTPGPFGLPPEPNTPVPELPPPAKPATPEKVPLPNPCTPSALSLVELAPATPFTPGPPACPEEGPPPRPKTPTPLFGPPNPATPGPPLCGPRPPPPTTPAQADGSTSIVPAVALPPKPATPGPTPLPLPCTPVPPLPGRGGDRSPSVPVPLTPIERPLTSTPISNWVFVSGGCVWKPIVAGPVAVNCVSVDPDIVASPVALLGFDHEATW